MTPKVGQDVVIRWIDSGAGDVGCPSVGKSGLAVKRTLGRVSFVGMDPKLHAEFCKPKKCRCHYVELTMCSAGKDDERSELASIWTQAIVELRVFK